MIRKTAILLMLFFWPTLALANLSGIWLGDDGGRYYLKQVDKKLYWYGEQKLVNPLWSNTFVGKIRDHKIKGSWVDVPKGRTNSRGTLILKIMHDGNVLVVSDKTGGFGGNRWTREGFSPPSAREPARTMPPLRSKLREDCVGFNPQRVQLSRIQGSWKIVEGNHSIFDFGNKKREAKNALRIIRHYGINQSCYVGRPNPSFKYLLVSDRAPNGFLKGEDCVRFNPDRIQASKIQGSWKIVEENHWIFDFGNKAGEARTSLALIKQHGFTRSCYVGRPQPSFTYLRR